MSRFGSLRPAGGGPETRSGAASRRASGLRWAAAGNAVLVFTRAGPSSLDEPGVSGQRVGYRWRDGNVDVMYWPQIDTPPATEPATFALTGGITRFQVQAMGGDGRWSSEWPVRGGADLPRAVRVEVALSDGSTIERWLALQ